MSAKARLGTIALLCFGLFAGGAGAESSYMGNCVNDAAKPAEDIVSACTGFISRAFQQNWQLEYVPSAMLYQAIAYERLEKYDLAEKTLKGAVTRYPVYPASWEELGKLLEKLKGPGYFNATMDAMIRANPGNPGMLNAACWLRTKNGGQFDAAIADCTESLRIRPGDAQTLDSRALAYFRKGNFQQAVTDATAALAANPKLAASLYVRGLAELKLGTAASGNADIAAAKSIDPKVADDYAGFGVAP